MTRNVAILALQPGRESPTSAESSLLRTEPAGELLSAFLSGRNECTRRAYRQDLDDFSRFVGASKASEAATLLLSRGHGEANALALAWRANLHERRLQAATINRRLAALRSLVQLARTLGIVPWALEVQNVRSESYRDTRGPGLNGVRLLLNEVERRSDAKSIRDRAILRLLYDLGLRRNEVVTLDVGDLDLPAGTIAVLGKGRTQRSVLTIPEPTMVALRAWVETRGDEPGPLFTNLDRAGKGCRLTGTSLYRIVRRLGAQVGLKVRPHGLRHSAITEACKAAQANGMGLEEVLDFSRHRDVKVLMVYRDRERDVQGQLAALVAATV
jgi:integrase/recombinase XerC